MAKLPYNISPGLRRQRGVKRFCLPRERHSSENDGRYGTNFTESLNTYYADKNITNTANALHNPRNTPFTFKTIEEIMDVAIDYNSDAAFRASFRSRVRWKIERRRMGRGS
jgi:hypothetical protein